MKIPATFKMMGMDYVCRELPEDLREDLHGLHNPADSTIYLDPTLKPQKLHATFYHEWMHAAFEAAGRDDLSENEGLVDTMGHLLYQFIKTKNGVAFAAPPQVKKAS